MYKIGDTVLFKGMELKVTAILSDKRYQLYDIKTGVILAHESEMVKL